MFIKPLAFCSPASLRLQTLIYWNETILYCLLLFPSSRLMHLHIYNTFCKALDEGKAVRAVFREVSKAFDRIWHKGFLYKFQTTGNSGSLLHWFTDDFHNRKRRVVRPGPEVIKLFSCSTQMSMKFSLLINMKMPIIVGIFIFISREIFVLSYV